MTVAEQVVELATQLDTLSGLRRVYTYPPESMSAFPCAVVYAQSGGMGTRVRDAWCDDATNVLIVEVHQSRQVLAKAVEASYPWIDAVYELVKTSAGLHVLSPVRWLAGALQWNDEVHYGIKFEITVRG
ncbi:MAG: hypothetical protein NAOJABEB_03146 [Steroidobacteraceae bacterium]|nr:hypothetical protein [Steroidobacteraceae bacterium]